MVIIFQVHQDIQEHTRVPISPKYINYQITYFFFRRVLRSVPVLAAINYFVIMNIDIYTLEINIRFLFLI